MKQLTIFRFVQIIFIILLVGSFKSSFSQACDECSRPKIVYYDCDVQVPHPPDSLPPLFLYWPAAAAIDYILTKSSNIDCITWIRQGYLNNIDKMSTGMPYAGPENLVIAPEGGNSSWDYLIRSTVTGSDGIYTFTLYLETAQTHELVQAFQNQFDSDIDYAKEVGQSVAIQFIPILETIQNFEVNKRNTDTRYAISSIESQDAREITVTPQKTLVNTRETIDVNIKMIDCDGVPLGNRSLIFVDSVIYTDGGKLYLGYGTEGGKITPEEAKTDESGNVTVQFTAGPDPGPAKIIVWYPHLTPCGHPAVFEGTALIQIEPPPKNLYILNANVNYYYSMHSDTTIQVDLGGYSSEKIYSNLVEEESNGRIIAVIENLAEDPSSNFSYSIDAVAPQALVVSGTGRKDEFSRYEETLDGKLLNANIRSDNLSGFASPAASIQFDYSDDNKYLSVGVSIKASGQYTGRYYFYEWSDYREDYHDYGLGVLCQGGSEDAGCSIIKVDTSGYSATYSFQENEKKSSLIGTVYISSNRSAQVSVVPLNSLTDVKKDYYNRLFPAEFSLSQNYPNPFNPVTNISYQLKSREIVKLKVYDILGKEIATLVEGISPQGTYTISWDASNISGGVYFYRLQAGKFIQTKKMILLK